MEIQKDVPEIGADDFARRFSLRSPNLMWLLGAGASASAGIPTAGDMVWEFKTNSICEPAPSFSANGRRSF